VSKQVNIRDIQALATLNSAFGRFRDEILRILPGIQKQFEQTEAWLGERQNHWERQVESARDELNAARRTLNDCEDSGYYDDEGEYQAPNCNFEEDQVTEAQQHLSECEANLETVKQWRHRIESEVSDFHSDLHRLSILASEQTGSAQAFLTNKLQTLEGYVATSPTGSVVLQSMPQTAIISQGGIPPLTDAGEKWKTLPPGIHTTTLVHVQSRFATNEKRKLLFDGFKMGIVALQKAGCKAVYLDGSFVSSKPDPGDFDACWDTLGVDESKLDPVLNILLVGNFFNFKKKQKELFQGEFFPSSSMADGESRFIDFFQTGRDGNEKGILKINL
jgi:hypothetical protein